ncbi:hypothetical protein I2492_09450 [Budviciaceae bacterium CWB-B4]|uniref:Uncharacterized protein n=1 Tax=Limnobaculum xujianqingii TaxID=2738837 RepID=A0A9D7AI45_9GAMM|nr:hypothetical protein [Limnobaculum xujianqingii]MBK5073240.1 hypothetical protein [Limnobaculum xujianqingii]MBK5176549.1 hypothetical protein [Limnobaculum xujianqingii]
MKLVLTAEQIKSLSEFAESEGQSEYVIQHGDIYDGDDVIYSGLIAYSGSEEHGVLQLD